MDSVQTSVLHHNTRMHMRLLYVCELIDERLIISNYEFKTFKESFKFTTNVKHKGTCF